MLRCSWRQLKDLLLVISLAVCCLLLILKRDCLRDIDLKDKWKLMSRFGKENNQSQLDIRNLTSRAEKVGYEASNSQEISKSPFEILQASRRDRIDKMCETIKTDPMMKKYYDEFTAPKVDKTFCEHVKVVKSKNLIWCKVPKAGSTTMSNIFFHLIKTPNQTFSTTKYAYKVNDLHVALRGETERQETYRRWAIRDLERNRHSRAPNSPWSVLLVRDPWERMQSAYQGKLHKEAGYYRSLYRDVFFPRGGPVEFPEFLQKLMFTDSNNPLVSRHLGKKGFPFDSSHVLLAGNEHFAPMYGLCDPCKYRYDFILKVENLKNETAEFLEHVGLHNLTKFDYGNLNPSKSSKYSSRFTRVRNPAMVRNPALVQKHARAEKPIATSVSSAALEEFNRIFKIDYEMFGYSPRVLKNVTGRTGFNGK